ncbi:MAG: NAD(+) synthase [Bacteroidales bacterium]|nr:NAD(+) synthase [Bacteroidales bacterium]
MKNYGFIRTAAAVPAVRLADVTYNVAEICRLLGEAFEKEVSLVAFPELSLTGYSCGDLFGQSLLIKGAEDGVKKIVEFSRGKALTIVVGAPVSYRCRLYSCAVVIRNGNIKGIVPKTYITAEEGRNFASGADFLSTDVRNDGAIRYAGQKCNISPNLIFGLGNSTFAIELGNDIWAPIPPSAYHVLQGAHFIVNLSADREILMREQYRTALLREHTAKNICGYVYASAGFGESTRDNVYAGYAAIWENGCMLAQNERYQTSSSMIISDIDIERIEKLRKESALFCAISPDGTNAASYYRLYDRRSLGEAAETDFEKKLYRHIEPHPFVPAQDLDYRCREIIEIQVAGLIKRLSHINCQTAVIGISGGLDSTLALIVTTLAFDRLGWSHERIVTVTMPGFGTTSRTKNNATDLMEALGTNMREISIAAACEQHFKDISHDSSVRDATYENSQARERTQILMDIANQTGGLVVGTGDLSELALGWCTYNGDHMSMYGVNGGVPKTLVQSLVRWAAENRFEGMAGKDGRSIKDILLDIVDTPISPELLPANENDEIQQVTEDLVGPYELHDFFIYNFIRCGYSPDKIFFLARKAFNSEEQGKTGISSYDDETILKWLRIFVRRFFNQQFKRSCMPDGPKVGSVGLSPRGDWDMPSDAWSTLFASDINP